MDKPILSKRAFLNVDMDMIDYDKDALYVLERIIGRGTSDDFTTIVKFYGKERIRREIVVTRRLGDKEVHFCCLIFELKLRDFKNYRPGLLRSNEAVVNEFTEYYQ